VLAAVLLHVIHTARTINRARHGLPRLRGQRLGQHVYDLAIIALDYVDNVYAVQAAKIVGLTAGSRIERCLIQHDCWMPVAGQLLANLSRETPQE
jgi:hypothetical protein